MITKREKLINAILYFVNNTKYCHKLKIVKLIYYLDFWYYKETRKSVTGLEYLTFPMGPVPVTLQDGLEPEKIPNDFSQYFKTQNEEWDNGEGRTLHIVPKKKVDLSVFSQLELKTMEKIVFIFKDMKAEDISDSTHMKHSPWDKTMKEKGELKTIDYELAIDEDSPNISEEEIEERKEINELYNFMINY